MKIFNLKNEKKEVEKNHNGKKYLKVSFLFRSLFICKNGKKIRLLISYSNIILINGKIIFNKNYKPINVLLTCAVSRMVGI